MLIYLAVLTYTAQASTQPPLGGLVKMPLAPQVCITPKQARAILTDPLTHSHTDTLIYWHTGTVAY